MAVINFGSINIDHVYQVEHFVQPGETLASEDYQQLLGGKGANQSIALAKAGAEGGDKSAAEWTLYIVGFLATIAATVLITKRARKALQSKTHLEDASEDND